MSEIKEETNQIEDKTRLIKVVTPVITPAVNKLSMFKYIIKLCLYDKPWTICILTGLSVWIIMIVLLCYQKYYAQLCDRDATRCYWGNTHCSIEDCCMRIRGRHGYEIVRVNPPCDGLRVTR